MTPINRGVFGGALILLAVVLLIVGTMSVIAFQRAALLGPGDILPLALCIAGPSVLFLFGGILAHKGELTLEFRTKSTKR